MRNDSSLGSKAFDVLGLLVQETLRDEQREVRVLVPGGLEHGVELLLHALPDPITARPDDHAAADG